MALDRKMKEDLISWQQNEITEYHVYHALADRAQSAENAGLLRQMAEDEKHHYDTLRNYTECKYRLAPMDRTIARGYPEMQNTQHAIKRPGLRSGIA